MLAEFPKEFGYNKIYFYFSALVRLSAALSFATHHGNNITYIIYINFNKITNSRAKWKTKFHWVLSNYSTILVCMLVCVLCENMISSLLYQN